MSEDLPEGWARGHLGDVASVDLGKMLDQAKHTAGTKLPYLRNANVRWGEFDLSDLLDMYFEPTEFDRYGLKPGDLLVCEGGEPGRAAVWPGSDHPIKYQKALLRVRPHAGIVPAWVMHSLKRDALNGDLEQCFTGSTIKHFPREAVLRYGFPVAPADEQKRIVAKIDALMAEADTIRARLARAPFILAQFRRAVLVAACTGKLTAEWRAGVTPQDSIDDLLTQIVDERVRRSRILAGTLTRPQSLQDAPAYELPDSWKWFETASLCKPERALTYGVIKLGAPVADGVPTLRSSDVRWLRIDSADIKRISPEIAKEYLRTKLESGEIVITVRGTLGGVALVPCEMAGHNVSREVAVLPVEPALNGQYLVYAIACLHSQNWLKERTKGAAYTGVNIEDLRLLPLPIPPRTEQDEIVRRIDALFALADAIERRVAAATARADKIPQAILTKAFRGELVPTEAELARAEGREYESASALLERIRKEREAASAKGERPKKSRGRRAEAG